MDINNMDVDYEKQNFEEMDANPYEIVIAAAKYAREVNEKFRKYFGSDCDVQPRNIAVKKLESDSLHLIYENEEEKDELTEVNDKEK